jgi:hypothetical protein
VVSLTTGCFCLNPLAARKTSTSTRHLGTQSPQDRPSFWTITALVSQQPTERGYAATREQAMVAFKLACDNMPERDPEALVAWAKQNI